MTVCTTLSLGVSVVLVSIFGWVSWIRLSPKPNTLPPQAAIGSRFFGLGGASTSVRHLHCRTFLQKLTVSRNSQLRQPGSLPLRPCLRSWPLPLCGSSRSRHVRRNSDLRARTWFDYRDMTSSEFCSMFWIVPTKDPFWHTQAGRIARDER